MAGKKHVASQKKSNRACTTESRFTSGVNGDRDDANVLKKGPWTPQEDTLLIKYVDINGERCWKNVQKMGLMRCGKSCRLRWTNHLRPDLKKGPFSSEEEKIVIELHQQVGNRWSKIAAKLPGRTDNEVKNFWNTKIKKRRMNNSPETIEENVLSTQQSEANETPSSGLPSMNSPKPFSPKDSILNSSNPSINPQNTFSLTNSNDNPSLEHGVKLPTNSTMHKEPMISFSNNSTDQINFMAEKRQKNMPSSVQNLSSTSMFNVLQNPLLNPFPGTHILEFATGSVYYNPNPFETNGSASVYKYKNSILDHGAWNESQSSKHAIKLEAQDQDHDPKNEEVTSILIEAKNDQVSNLNGSNYYYSGLSTMEVTPMKELVEDKMEATDDELLSLLDSFSFEESPPKLHLKSEVENIVPSYGHYYLDQKIAFPSFSKASTSTASGVNSPRSTSSELDECIDTDDWINEPESS